MNKEQTMRAIRATVHLHRYIPSHDQTTGCGSKVVLFCACGDVIKTKPRDVDAIPLPPSSLAS
jgi:hypothetical protein